MERIACRTLCGMSPKWHGLSTFSVLGGISSKAYTGALGDISLGGSQCRLDGKLHCSGKDCVG